MSWTTPKTDWKSSDYFLLEDWNRIVSNAQELYNLIGATFSWRDCVLADTAAMPYYDIVNNLENNLADLQSTLGQPFIQFLRTVWYPRTSTSWTHNPSAEDFIRWEEFEKTLYKWYNIMASAQNAIYAGTFYAGTNRSLQMLSRGR